MTDKAKELISLHIQQIINDNSEQIQEALFHGVDSSMDKDRIYAKMILNSISVSTTLTSQIILELLDSKDIIHVNSDERLLQKLALKIHTDNSKL